MATKYSLGEQVLLRLTEGRPDQASRFDIRECILAVCNALNEQIKAQHYSVQLPSGETIPEGTVLATYENVPVTAWKKGSRILLPAVPVHLARGQGVFAISKNDDPYCLFIPALPGQIAMIQSQQLFSSLVDFYLYEQYGMYIEFEKNLLAKNITSVMVRLLVSDVDTLSDYEPLPIPADYVGTVVDTAFKRLASQLPNDKDTDLFTENKVGK